jgi:tetratricopeptide (TPR) repeat protein
LLGDLYRDSGSLEQAAAHYQQAQLLAEPPVIPLLRLADLAQRGGDTGEARRLIERADSVAQSPLESLSVHAAAALLESRLGRLHAAIAQIEAQRPFAEQALPPFSVALSIYATLAATYTELGDMESAELALATGKQMLQPPLDQFLAFIDAVVEMHQGEFDAAEQSLTNAAAIIEQFDFEPLRFQLDFVRSELLARRGEFAEAAQLCARAVEAAQHSIIGNDLTAQLPGLFAELAEVQVDAGLLDEAEKSVTHGLLLDPNHPRLWVEKARLQQARGMTPLALASLNYALTVWQDADADFAQLKKARRLHDELTGATP